MLVDITKTAVFNVTLTKYFFCIYFGVGSKNGSDDVYPEQQVGFGEFGGGASLTSEGIKLSVEGNMTVNYSRSSSSSSRRKRDIASNFYMEPGRSGSLCTTTRTATGKY